MNIKYCGVVQEIIKEENHYEKSKIVCWLYADPGISNDHSMRRRRGACRTTTLQPTN